MNKPKLLIATTSRVLLNVLLVVAMVLLASLVGVGGAALWIYGHPETTGTMAKRSSPQLKAVVASAETSRFPLLTPVHSDDNAPAQLTPARYVPTDSEIATVSDTPRYTYISYNGGRQQAHLRINTVLSSSVPAPLTTTSIDDAAPVQTADRPPLFDSASHYITDAHGRVIGVDGTAGAVAEARAVPVTTAGVAPEVRVAAPVTEYGQPVYAGGRVNASATPATTNYLPIRKALPVNADDDDAPVASAFNVQAELSRDEDRPVARALPVERATRPTRPALLGASDNFQSFGRN